MSLPHEVLWVNRRSQCRIRGQNAMIIAMDGMYAGFARLQGRRRYDPRDGGGRIASGTAIESNAGAVAEEQKPVIMTVASWFGYELSNFFNEF